MACRTRGSEHDEVWMCLARVRFRALIITGSGNIVQLVLSSKVLTSLCLERASAGAILVPGVTCQTVSKSCRNKDQCTCYWDSFCRSFT